MANLSRLSPEESVLAARVEDLARTAARGKSHFTAFLNEREQLIAQEVIRRNRLEGCVFWGGYPDAVRKMLGVFPGWQEPEEAEFPLEPVAILLPKGAALSHRDVLGSLMSLRITREAVGDILIAERRCDVFLQRSVAGLVVQELVKIGGTGVRCETGLPGEYIRSQEYEPVRGTVSSARVDALVSVLTGLSREKSAVLIRSEQVQRNYQTVRSLADEFSAGDVLTIRGKGKYKVDEIGSPTRKGRLPVLCSKYL